MKKLRERERGLIDLCGRGGRRKEKMIAMKKCELHFLG